MQTHQQATGNRAAQAAKKIAAFIIIAICMSFGHFANAQTTDFKFTANTSLGTLPTQFIFPGTGGAGGYSIFVDGSSTAFATAQTAAVTVTGLTPGVHTFRVSGNLTRVAFNNGGDKLKITSIDQWGSAINWTNFNVAYYGCTNLTINATDAPVLTSVTDMSSAFRTSGISTTGNLNSWVTTNVVSMPNMFLGCTSLNQPLNNWDVKNVTVMNSMFNGCSNFNQPLGNWNVSKITSFVAMFINCTNFNQNLSAWNTNGGGFNQSAAVNMQQMFSGCTNFNNGDVAGASTIPLTWSATNKVTDMSSMFLNCTSFNQPVTALRVNAVVDFSTMFQGCTSFNQNINAWNTNNGGFNQAAAISMVNTFRGCTLFNNGDPGDNKANPLTWSTTNKVTTMNSMFVNCTSFNQSLANFCVSAVTDFGSMFYGAAKFNQNLNSWGTNCGGFNTAGITITAMFYGCTAFNNGDAAGASTMPLSSWNTIGVTNMTQVFSYCSSFNQPLNNWNVSNATNFNSVFYGCTVFNQPLNAWSVNNATNFNYMFYGCTNFNQPLDAWVISKVTNFGLMFQGCTNFNQDLTNWGTNGTGFNQSSAIAMTNMFVNCSNFNNGDAGNNQAKPLNTWNTSMVTDMGNMFSGAAKFNQSLSAWNISSVTSFSGMFYSASLFNQNVTAWGTNGGGFKLLPAGTTINMNTMFQNCSVFNNGETTNTSANPLNAWNVSTVTTMQSMFSGATKFNQDVSGWDVSKNTNFFGTFQSASAFNQNISGWNVGAGTIFQNMFIAAAKFNQNLSNWNIDNATDGTSTAARNNSMTNMLASSGMSQDNYDATLIAWAARPARPVFVNFIATAMRYCAAVNARAQLNTTDGWNITSDALSCSPGGVAATGLKYWLQADAIGNTTSTALATWQDISGSGNDFKQTTPANQPIASVALADAINFNPTVSFDGTDDFMSTTTTPLGASSNQMVTFIVSKETVRKDNVTLGLGYTDALNQYSVSNPNAAGNLLFNAKMTGNPDLAWTYASADAVGIPSVNAFLRTNGASGVIPFTDGKRGPVSTYAFIVPTGVNTLGGLSMPGVNFNGKIAEVILYNTTLSYPQITEINSYLCMKYGKTPAADINGNNTTGEQLQASPLIKDGDLIASDLTTIVWNYTSNKPYHNDVIALGTDEKMNLSQKVSKSENADNIVTLSTTNDFTSLNTNASRVDLPDLTYLVVGNNDSSNVFTGTGAPTNFMVLKRTWKAQVTGTPGSVYIQFDMDNANFDVPFKPNYYVVTDANADGSLTDETPVLLNNTSGSLWSANVSIPNNALFTIASFIVPAPGGVTGFVRWYKGSAGVTTGSTFTWVDQAGTGNNATQSTAANQPTYNTTGSNLLNFNPSLGFAGSGALYFNDAGMPAGSTARSVFAVAGSNTTGGPFEWISGYGNTVSNQAFGMLRTGNNILTTVYGNDLILTGTPYVSNLPVISFGALNSTTLFAGYNGGTVSSKTVAPNTTLAGATGGYIGAKKDGTQNWNGLISEVIYYNSQLAGSDKQKVESYLAFKYGIALDNSAGGGSYLLSDGTTAWDASTNTAYQNKIIGLVRDDASALRQKQSHTQDDSLRIFMGSLATDNASNTATITNNLSSVMIGSDGGSATMNTLLPMPAGITSRFGKTWKITNNNFNGSFSLEIKWDSASLVYLSKFRLLVSHSTDFSGASVYGPADGVVFSAGSIIISGLNSSIITPGDNFITVGATALTLLPVGLTDFNAVLIGKKVDISWQTAFETSNDYFIVEKSVDQNDWAQTAILKAAGNSSSPKNYSTVDYFPYNGVSYYRLKQINIDGSYSYSEIRTVKTDKTKNNYVVIYPNPASGQVTIKGDAAELNTMMIYNLSGQDVTGMVNTIKIISGPTTQMVLDVSRLAQGVYSKTTNSSTKLIKK